MALTIPQADSIMPVTMSLAEKDSEFDQSETAADRSRYLVMMQTQAVIQAEVFLKLSAHSVTTRQAALQYDCMLWYCNGYSKTDA